MPQSHAAEEMALHKIIEAASNDFDVDEDGFITGLLEPLPHSTKDADFNLVSDLAFDDHDVLMLFQNPHVSEGCEASSIHGPSGQNCSMVKHVTQQPATNNTQQTLNPTLNPKKVITLAPGSGLTLPNPAFSITLGRC
jgi:hypothetical protein